MNKKQLKIIHLAHPEYSDMRTYWEKFRYTYNGGKDFVNKYTKKFSIKENDTDFANRKEMTYCPAHAKAAVIEVKNAIYERMPDIRREGGPKTYQDVVKGSNGGVDLHGRSMDDYIGTVILPELLVMSKVAVFVDKEPIEEGSTKADIKNVRPYLYHYIAEDIQNWNEDENGNITSILLRSTEFEVDETYKLPTRRVNKWNHFYVTDAVVHVDTYNAKSEKEGETRTLGINRIPVVIFQISHSLLTDVADYQIALVNMESADINYAIKSNFPFYIEQYDPKSLQGFLKKVQEDSDIEENETEQEIKVGSTQGRRYGKDLDAPTFINPSSEPLRASMEKEAKIKEEIRYLVNLSVANLAPLRSSADSKQQDHASLEAGLAYIGLELARGEREIGEIWALYEDSTDIPIIVYPDKYSRKTDEERLDEADKLSNVLPKVPSLSFQKFLAKRIITTLTATSVSTNELVKMHSEIDKAKIVVIDPEVLKTDIELGLVSNETASKARLYPEGEVEQAKKDHAERIKRIAESQMTPEDKAPGARGVDDLDPEPRKSAKDEKTRSREIAQDTEVKTKVRGKGK